LIGSKIRQLNRASKPESMANHPSRSRKIMHAVFQPGFTKRHCIINCQLHQIP
jgi:hypothetical protein